MSKSTFTKPPLSPEEKAAKEREFLSFDKTQNDPAPNIKVKKEKEPAKSKLIRAPISFWEDMQEISIITGLSMNAVCLELLRPAIKKKLKELKED